jgi:hypothetical protein
MSTYLKLSAALGLMMAVAAPAFAQSLGDVARKEEARRKAVKTAGKVYTNDTIQASTPASEAVPAAAQPAAPQPDPKAAEQTDEPKKDEAYWRGRIGEARQGLSRAQMFQEALQSRINALSADFVNRDDPAQRAQISNDRQKSLSELERVKQEIKQYEKSITDIEDEARKAGVPPGWLR